MSRFVDIRVENGSISLINGERFTKDDFEDKFWHAKTVEELFIFINRTRAEKHIYLFSTPCEVGVYFQNTYASIAVGRSDAVTEFSAV